MNKVAVMKWSKKVGHAKATQLIIEELKCSVSKADKIANGTYPSLPTHLEQMALANLMNLSRENLFPLLAQGKEKAS